MCRFSRSNQCLINIETVNATQFSFVMRFFELMMQFAATRKPGFSCWFEIIHHLFCIFGIFIFFFDDINESFSVSNRHIIFWINFSLVLSYHLCSRWALLQKNKKRSNIQMKILEETSIMEQIFTIKSAYLQIIWELIAPNFQRKYLNYFCTNQWKLYERNKLWIKFRPSISLVILFCQSFERPTLSEDRFETTKLRNYKPDDKHVPKSWFLVFRISDSKISNSELVCISIETPTGQNKSW